MNHNRGCLLRDKVEFIFLTMRHGARKYRVMSHFGDNNIRECDHPGCDLPAEHRAPKSREFLEEFHWFCLDHVREYNKSWNFCAGMDADQIENEIREDTVWRRPTWPMGNVTTDRRWRFIMDGEIGDKFGGFRASQSEESDTSGPHGKNSDTLEVRAFRILGLDPSASLSELKARYKELVMVHHPDRNGGDKKAEERLKDINDAYSTLRKCVTV